MLHSMDDSLLPCPVSSRSKGRSGEDLGLATLLDCSGHANREAIVVRDRRILGCYQTLYGRPSTLLLGRSKGRSGEELGLARLLDCSRHASREIICGRDRKTTRVQTGSVWSSVSLYMWSTSFYRYRVIPRMHSEDD